MPKSGSNSGVSWIGLLACEWGTCRVEINQASNVAAAVGRATPLTVGSRRGAPGRRSDRLAIASGRWKTVDMPNDFRDCDLKETLTFRGWTCEKNEAFQRLENGHGSRENCMIYLKTDFTFDALRPDPQLHHLKIEWDRQPLAH